jgi:hypothetical protein
VNIIAAQQLSECKRRVPATPTLLESAVATLQCYPGQESTGFSQCLFACVDALATVKCSAALLEALSHCCSVDMFASMGVQCRDELCRRMGQVASECVDQVLRNDREMIVGNVSGLRCDAKSVLNALVGGMAKRLVERLSSATATTVTMNESWRVFAMIWRLDTKSDSASLAPLVHLSLDSAMPSLIRRSAIQVCRANTDN